MQQYYYSALASVIMISARDDVQKRRAIYELARSELRQKLQKRFTELAPLQRAQQLRALENAIEQIEADLAQNVPLRTYSRGHVRTSVTPSSVEIIPPEYDLPPLAEPLRESLDASTDRRNRSMAGWALPLIGAAALGAVTYVAVERGLQERTPTVMATAKSRDGHQLQNRSPVAKIPTPISYGVYVLADEHLTELKPLPIKVPAQRAAIAGLILSPSTTNLPTGSARFVVFRRDLANNAPEKVAVRVVARVIHASAGGQTREPPTSSAGESWTVRDSSYEMKVSPVDGNPAMILIRPADAGFSFPSGRYALVLKDVAYDFSVDGPITDLAQCVERTDELNPAAYTQCRNP